MTAVEIVALHASRVHAFEGRPSDGPRPDPEPVGRSVVEVRAGKGIVGDRFFNHPAHRKGLVTVIAAESLDAIGVTASPLLTRRNIALRGFPIDTLAARRGTPGSLFSLDSGAGPIRFQAHRPASPCVWMDVVLGQGACRGLRGHGGVRCVPLDDGELRVGPAELEVLSPTLL
ncbi:molybdenum cofactor biosysynthesis protein [Kibdelosporangium persicum]|uniref:MOSC domain-containing protein YiiM n=1 Tax=Kibdelosporangium persicum TaxID=2698649 RepID=A0ABX2F364_9PSEU|nr:molybdenum cofactor biosysynthesis protein [Kibdelosporangium persicum]NRN65280.1 MOSC domain-containing protein YiiM [Kibdelosporangium persicum]